MSVCCPRLVRALSLAWLALQALTAPSRAADDGVRRALLIGIESYASFGDAWVDLDGPFNDIALVSEVLRQRFDFDPEHVTELRDARRADIEGAFESLIADTRSGDHVYIHYSGHGSRVLDANGDEETGGFDSTLVPVGARDDPRGEILDDEIALWMHRLRQKTPHVVLVVDACHSGTISRAAETLKTRGAPSVDERSYAWSKDLDLSVTELDSAEDRFVRLSACLDSQKAKEYRAQDDRIYGLFTWYWCQALMESGSDDTYGTMMRRVAARVFRERPSLQHPQIEGRDDALLFAGTVRELPRLLTVRGVEAGTVRLQGGLLQGVALGSTFETVEDADEPSLLEIVRVDATTSLGKTVAGPPPALGDLLREKARAQRLPPFRVSLDSQARDLLGASLADLTSIEPAEQPPFDAVLQVSGGDLTILDARGDSYGGGLLDPRALISPVAAGPEPVLRALRRCYDLRDVMQMTRSHLSFRPDVEIELLQLQQASCESATVVAEINGTCWDSMNAIPLVEDEPSVTFEPNTVLAFRIHNDSLETLYFYLFNFSPDGRIQQFFPRPGEDSRAEVWSGDTLLPGKSSFALEESALGLLDTYVWFVTQEPADLRFLAQDSFVPTRGASTRVERLAQRFGGRATRGEAPVPLQTGDLATRMISIEVRGRNR